MISCDDEYPPCPQPPPDRSVQAAVVGGLFGVLASVGPEVIRWWREHRDERLTLERRIAHLEAGEDKDDDE